MIERTLIESRTGELQNSILFQLMNYQRNLSLLENVPHIRYLDLAIVFYCKVTAAPYEDGTLLLQNAHLKPGKGITPETLCLHAFRNTCRVLPAYIQTMEDVMKGLPDGLVMGHDDREDAWLTGTKRAYQSIPADHHRLHAIHFYDRRRMYVLSNEPNLYGASAILYPTVLRRFADRLKANLYLLPGSLHEMVILPDDDRQRVSELRQLVADANQAQVSPDEVLSNGVYYYDRRADVTLIIGGGYPAL